MRKRKEEPERQWTIVDYQIIMTNYVYSSFGSWLKLPQRFLNNGENYLADDFLGKENVLTWINLLVFSTRIKNVFEKKTIFVLLEYCEKKVFYSKESDIRTQRDFHKRFILKTSVRKMDVFGCKRKLQSWNDPINGVFQFKHA